MQAYSAVFTLKYTRSIIQNQVNINFGVTKLLPLIYTSGFEESPSQLARLTKIMHC